MRPEKTQAGLAEKVLGSFKPDWEKEWRDLAQLTVGITKTDSRYIPVCDALEDCDESFLAHDWLRFQEATKKVKRVLKKDKR